MTARGRDKRGGERGQILAMMVISLIALCALVGVAADLGFFSDYRRRMQTAADAAAMAGAQQLLRDADSATYTKIRSAALDGSTSNGFTDSADDALVAPNWPPSSGFHVGNPSFVEAIITQPRPTIFMAILGFQSATVSARAVAGIVDANLCILALNQTQPKAINLNGSFTVDAQCRVADNSNDPDALDDSGGAILKAKSIAVTGDVGGNKSNLTPAPQTGVPREPDPFARLSAPTFSPTCTSADCNVNHSSSSYTNCTINNTGTYTLSPGTYCGGITVHGSSGCSTDVTFQPGLYVLYGGGFNVNGGCIHGTGVTFYNTGATSGPNKYSGVTITGSVSGGLYAATTGAMAAILFFGDRTLTLPGGQTDTINGGTNLTLEGTLYFPRDPVKFAGGSSSTGAAAYSILIADAITFTGGATFNDDFTKLPNGSPTKTVALAE